MPQPAAHVPNAVLSQDLLRQLQLGQSRMQAADAQAYPQQHPAGLLAYQQATPAYMQAPNSAGLYSTHDQPHLQVCPSSTAGSIAALTVRRAAYVLMSECFACEQPIVEKQSLVSTCFNNRFGLCCVRLQLCLSQVS